VVDVLTEMLADELLDKSHVHFLLEALNKPGTIWLMSLQDNAINAKK
jgi:hypothetical protein